MARDFIPASNHHLSNANAVLTAAPLTISAWFSADVVSALRVMLSIDASGAFLNAFILGINTSGGNHLVRATTYQSSTSGEATSTTNATLGQWHHGCAVFAGAAERYAYLDGGGKGSNTTSKTPASLDRTLIGSVNNTDNEFDGDLCEIGVWNVALTDDEVAMLGTVGLSPLLVRPQNLVSYWPIIGRTDPEPDLVGDYPMTVDNNPPVSSHVPTIIYPSRSNMKYATAAIIPPAAYKRRFIIAIPG